MTNHSEVTTNSHKSSVAESSMIPLPAIYQPQSLTSSLEEQKDDWSPSQILGFLKRRALVITGVAALVMAGVAAKTFTEKSIYQSDFLILVEPLKDEDKWKNITSPLGNDNLPKSGLDYESQILVLRSRELLNKAVANLKPRYPDISFNSLVSSLNINRYRKTKALNVSYSSPDAKKVKVVLDAIAQSYLKYSLEERQTELRQGLQFVEEKLPPLRNRVDRLEDQIKTFRQKYNFYNPESELGLITGQLSSSIEKRQSIDTELATLRANLASLQASPGQLAALNEATLYQNLLGQVRQLEAEIAQESARFRNANPRMQTFLDRRQRLLPLLQQEAERILGVQLAGVVTQIQLLEVRSQELAKIEQQLQLRSQQLPVLEKRFIGLQRNLKFATESLNRFLATRETLQIAIAQTELPWKLIREASQPLLPVSPNITRNLLMGLVASAILGVGAGVVFERMDDTYHSVDELKERVKFPLLGTIPVEKELSKIEQENKRKKDKSKKKRSSKEVQDVLTKDNSMLPEMELASTAIAQPKTNIESSQFWEAFQVLLNNIRLLGSDSPIRSIVISSSMPGEGKSTVSYYLSQIAASVGLKVLLVDTDMRNPSIHKMADLTNLWGLSSLISGDFPVEQAIQKMPNSECSVITAGMRPPDTIKLLSSEKMKRMMMQFQVDYDLVIYDAPPLTGLADASIVASHTDGVIAVGRIDKTNKTAFSKALDELKFSPINVLGIVANSDKHKHKGYDKYYYY
ncbi:MAG: polysaccharide biosynthesis tyrosine autokinase [Cyanobacteria bacterium J06633_8]